MSYSSKLLKLRWCWVLVSGNFKFVVSWPEVWIAWEPHLWLVFEVEAAFGNKSFNF